LLLIAKAKVEIAKVEKAKVEIAKVENAKVENAKEKAVHFKFKVQKRSLLHPIRL
jgi:hypothetical protein